MKNLEENKLSLVAITTAIGSAIAIAVFYILVLCDFIQIV